MSRYEYKAPEYISVREAAFIMGKTKRLIQKRCTEGKYRYKKIINESGIPHFRILFSSIEAEYQEKYKMYFVLYGADFISSQIQHHTPAPFSLNEINPLLEEEKEEEKSEEYPLTSEQKELLKTFDLEPDKKPEKKKTIPQHAKEKALSKVDLINAWDRFRENETNKTLADKEFIGIYNLGIYCETIFKTLGKVSLKTLYRWKKYYKDSKNDWTTLIDNYTWGCESCLISELSGIERFLLLKYMLHQNRFKLSKAYEYIKKELSLKGLEAKTIGAYRHVWNFVTSNHSDLVKYARCGNKEAMDKEFPHINKDNSRLEVADVITGDGHVLDFLVRDPNTGRGTRAVLVAFQDDASRDIVGYDIMTTENTQVIASALRHAILYMGKIPKVVHLDNGRAFKGKIFTGESGIDLSQSKLKGLYEQLGIKTIFSQPYNGRAKSIERFFKEFTESFSKLLPSYIGNDIEHQPASLRRNEKFHKSIQGEFIPTIEETKELIDKWLNEIYRQRICPIHPAFTIKEVMENSKGDGVDTEKLDDLMLVSKKRQIKKGFIKLFSSNYYSPKLVGLNQQVIAKYDMFDLRYIKVYSLKGDYICKAERETLIHPYAELLGNAKDINEFRHKTKELQNLRKERIRLIKRGLKTLYGKRSFTKMLELKKQEVKREEKKYEIDFAEDKDIFEKEREIIYRLDYEKLIKD